MTITAERVRELLHYNPETGEFTWRVGRGRVRKGLAAGSAHCEGYVRLKMDGRDYLLHRLAWMYVHGYLPAFDIDHINGVRNDNRLANLRECTRGENLQNIRRSPTGSKHGVLGATRVGKKWVAQIKHEGRCVRLGRFDTPKEAQEAYIAAKTAFHPFWAGEIEGAL